MNESMENNSVRWFSMILCVCLVMSDSANAVNLFKNCPNFNNTEDFRYYFRLWLMVPFNNHYKHSRDKVALAVDRALTDAANALYESTNINITKLISKPEYRDTKCDADYAMGPASDIHDVSLLESCSNDSNDTRTKVDFVIGVSCDYVAGRIGVLANNWNWPVIFPAVRTDLLNEKENQSCCATMTRTGITMTDTGQYIIELYEKYNWNKSVVVYSSYNSHGADVSYTASSDCSSMLGGITKAFRNHGWIRYDFYNIITRSYDSDIEEDADKILQEISSMARVSLWCIGKKTMRRIMMKAREMGQTKGDYAFLYLDLYNTNRSFTWTDADDSPANETGNEEEPSYSSENFQDEKTTEALKALHIISLRNPKNDEYITFSDEIKEQLAMSTDPEVKIYEELVHAFLADYYDATLLLLYGIFRSLCDGTTKFLNGKAFAASLWDVKFQSLGRNITINENGDPYMDYSLLDFNAATKTFEVVLDYYGATNQFVAYDNVDWPGPKVPVNEPECGYEDEYCSTTFNTVALIAGLSSGILLILVVAIAMLARYNVGECVENNLFVLVDKLPKA